MSEFIREVDEEVRREQQLKLWRKYGVYVVGVGVVIIVVASSVVFWRNYQESARLDDSAAFNVATVRAERGELAAAADAFFELSENAGGGYAPLATLREARTRIINDDVQGGISSLDRLAADGGSDTALRQIATLSAIVQMMNSGKLDGIDDRLADLADADSPWSSTAYELRGLVALQRGDMDEARRLFADLASDPSIVPGVRTRAGEILAAIGGSGE